MSWWKQEKEEERRGGFHIESTVQAGAVIAIRETTLAAKSLKSSWWVASYCRRTNIGKVTLHGPSNKIGYLQVKDFGFHLLPVLHLMGREGPHEEGRSEEKQRMLPWILQHEGGQSLSFSHSLPKTYWVSITSCSSAPKCFVAWQPQFHDKTFTTLPSDVCELDCFTSVGATSKYLKQCLLGSAATGLFVHNFHLVAWVNHKNICWKAQVNALFALPFV